MNEYLRQVWCTRYFWLNLALSDLRARWRRSFFGALWSIIHPLGMALILSFVLGRLLQMHVGRYAPYLLSGLIVWEFATFCVTNGASSFIYSAPYIKQCRHPLAIYTARTVFSAMLVLAMASLPLYLWAIIATPENFGFCWLASLTLFPMLMLIFWPLSTLLAYVGTRFRDLPHALTLLMQILYFVSPIYFSVKMFEQAGLGYLVTHNPIYHVLQIIRAPLLAGHWPSIDDYLFSICTALVFAALAWLTGRRLERGVIFFL